MSELDVIYLIAATWLYLVIGLFVIAALAMRDPVSADHPVLILSLFDWLAWPYAGWRRWRRARHEASVARAIADRCVQRLKEHSKA